MPLRKMLVLGVLFVASSTLGGAQGVRHPVANEVALYARLLSMTDTRQLDTALVERALAGSWSPLRAAAVMAIGQVSGEVGRPGAPRLRSLLTDKDSAVAADAAYALGLLRDTAGTSALASALRESGAVAREAAWALGEIGEPARSAIITALSGRQRDDVSIQLLLAAAKLRPVPIAAIEPYLKAKSPPMVWAAAYAIARTRAPAGVRDLVTLYESRRMTPVPRLTLFRTADEGPYANPSAAIALIKAEIARGISKSAAGDSLGPSAFSVLSRLVFEPDPHVRINALRSIATYGASAHGALTRATHDADPNVRIAAAQSFGSVLSKNTTDLETLWEADTSIVYRSSLLASAARAGLRPAPLRTWATSNDWRLRAAVASAEGDSLDRTFAISRAAPLTRDPDPRVREAAYGALSPPTNLPLEDSVHALLLAGLRDPDFYVRATILGALAQRPSPGDLNPVLASYSVATRDSANDARLAALQYVAALWKKDSSAFTPAVTERLSQFNAPVDPLERAAARGVQAWAEWSKIPVSPRPRDWYENVVRSAVLPTLAGKPLTATIHTVRGPIYVELYGADAPITVLNFLALARSGYYRNTRFHRVVPNFVAQDGDPRDDGNGGPGYAIRDEMNRRRYERGAVGMALSGPDTGGSQYFITHSPQPHLDGHYTVFGRVTKGFDVLDRIVQGDQITQIDPR
jgi:cyclophilin family peptidyl-prolyl cis-trans isomerase/HEAT repeat protein